MFPIVEGYHSVLVYRASPDLAQVALSMLLGLLLLASGFFLFHRANEEMADAL